MLPSPKPQSILGFTVSKCLFLHSPSIMTSRSEIQLYPWLALVLQTLQLRLPWFGMSSELIKSKQVLNTDTLSLRCSLQMEECGGFSWFLLPIVELNIHIALPIRTIQITPHCKSRMSELTAVTYYCSIPTSIK